MCDTFPDTEFYTAMLNHSSDGLCLIDRKEGTVRLVNEPLCQLLNRVSDSLKGKTFGAIFSYDWSGEPDTRQVQYLGGIQPLSLEISIQPFSWQGDRYGVVTVRDITAQLHSREALVETGLQRNFALNDILDGLWEINLQTNEVYISSEFKRIMDFPAEKTHFGLGEWQQQIHLDDCVAVMDIMNAHLRGEIPRFDAEYRLQTFSGEYVWVHDQGRVYERDARQQPLRMVGMVQDISAAKAQEVLLRRQASHDYLTDLLNRRAGYMHFRKQLSYAQRYGRQFSVSLIDLDHFKSINDTYGHQVGDQVLKHLVAGISEQLRQSDTLMRWGGEEFLLLLPNTDSDGAFQLVEQLRKRVAEQPMPLSDGEVQYTFSAGVASFPQHAEQMDMLIKAADDALYVAKSAGRNQVSVSDEVIGIAQGELSV